MRTMTNLWCGIAAVALVLFAGAASAQDGGTYDQFNDRFRVYLGGFWPDVDSKIGINGDILPPGPPVNIEDTLGVEDGDGVLWGGIQWHISRRNSLEFEFFDLNRDGRVSGTFSPPIQLGDTIIEGGAINTKYDTAVGRLTYGFSIIRNERADVQLKVGLHLAKLEAGVQFAGAICDGTTTPPVPPGCPTAQTSVEEEDVTAPLPHLGGSFAYAITPAVAFNFQVIGFALELDDIDGSMVEVAADLSWTPWRNFGFGAGMRYFSVEVDSTGSDLNGEFEFDYWGPALYVQSTF
ncbi:MAG: hypothetical protein ACR2QV_05190 [Gammaproteobacteria bacterium]